MHSLRSLVSVRVKTRSIVINFRIPGHVLESLWMTSMLFVIPRSGLKCKRSGRIFLRVHSFDWPYLEEEYICRITVQFQEALCMTWSRDQLSVNMKTVHFWKFCQHKLKEHIKIREPEHFQPYISKVAITTAAESWKQLFEKNNFCHPVTLAWFSIQILVISKFSKLSWNISKSIKSSCL